MNGPGHWGVEVVGNEVMLCECDNEGTIMVYDKELKYLRCIQHERAGKLRDLSADSHGNLYATDYSNNCIQVFSKDGVFLCSFSCDANGDQKLDVPCGVCVSGQHVYVASCKKNEVVVFTTDGVYTTTLVHNDDEAPGNKSGNENGNKKNGDADEGGDNNNYSDEDVDNYCDVDADNGGNAYINGKDLEYKNDEADNDTNIKQGDERQLCKLCICR